MELSTDMAVRRAAFDFLDRQVLLHGEEIPWSVLAAGFSWQGRRVPIVSQQGIFKPAVLGIPLSIRTTPPVEGKEAPYDDRLSDDGVIRYRYRGTDPQHRDNVGLRKAMTESVPLVYCYGIVTGIYYPVWPAYVVGDDPQGLTFTIRVDDPVALTSDHSESEGSDRAAEGADGRRAYVTASTQRRLHQAGFRHRVLRAYRRRCAICRLKRSELLDAAHILPDRHPKGDPVVPNGLSLCKLHHAAFDGNIVGVRPDYTIDVRRDVLEEVDGPMLVHGLQGFQDEGLTLPTNLALRPDPERLAERYEEFRAA